VADIESLLLAQGPDGETELQNGYAGRIVFQDVGGEHPGRHLAERGLHGGSGLGHCHIDLDIRMKVNLDHRVAGVRLGFDVLDVIDVRSEAPFEVGDDAFLHLLGRQTRVDPQHTHNWNVDVGEDVHRHGHNGGTAQNGDED